MGDYEKLDKIWEKHGKITWHDFQDVADEAGVSFLGHSALKKIFLSRSLMTDEDGEYFLILEEAWEALEVAKRKAKRN